MFRSPLVCIFSAAWLAVSAPAARAALFIYDGFAAGGSSPTGMQYFSGTAGTGLTNDSLVRSSAGVADGQMPATLGFDATQGWRTTTLTSTSVYPRENAAGLSYSGLTTVAGAADIFRAGSNGSAQSKFAARQLEANLAAGASDLYFSALIQFDTGVPGNVEFDEGTARLGFGVDNTGKVVLFNQGSTLMTGTNTLTGGTTYLLVAHVNSAKKVDLWLNPTDFQTESNNTTQKVFSSLTLTSFTAGLALTDFRITTDTGSGVSNPDFIVDEVRGATTWQEALGIPEPGAGVLVLAGVVMLGGWRRARR